MEFQGRAFYNLLRFNAMEDQTAKSYEPWQIEDYRSLSDQELFDRLKKLKIALSIEAFHEIARNIDTPELMASYLTHDEAEVEEEDQIYLIIFELWRRLMKDCRSLSIFADEFDRWMEVYDGQKEDVDDIVHSFLFELENFLDEAHDSGKDPHETFAFISSFFAHDLENFIYDFIYDRIEKEALIPASELIDALMPYVSRGVWLEFLRLKMFSKQDVEQLPFLVHRFAEKVVDTKDLELLIEVLDLMIGDSLVDLFFQFFDQGLALCQTYQQLLDMAAILKEFYQSIEDHVKSQRVDEVLYRLTQKEGHKKLIKQDPLVEMLKQVALGSAEG
jgi:hypothetical protein